MKIIRKGLLLIFPIFFALILLLSWNSFHVHAAPTILVANSTDPFDGVPHPSGPTFTGETESDESVCRNYTSGSPPYTIVANYGSLLESSPYLWNVGEIFKTGLGYEDSASFYATKDVREMAVRANGTGGLSSAMSVCINKETITTGTVVTNTQNSGAGSLRQVIADANPGDTITFDPSLSGMTITLTTGELLIGKDLNIDASSLLGRVYVSGNNANRVFHIHNGASVTLNRLAIIDGKETTEGTNYGGGIINFGDLALVEVLVTENTAGYGGGIENRSVMTLTDSTVSANTATSRGGGVSNDSLLTVDSSTINGNTALIGGGLVNIGGPKFEIVNSTVSGNQADLGGGIYTNGNLTLKNVTVNANRATGSGGGLLVLSSSAAEVVVQNTLVANSVAGTDCVASLSFDTNMNNLIEDGSCSPTVTGDPQLGPLDYNGGKTLTHFPMQGSPAIDAGNNPICQTDDQRGITRPFDGDSTPPATCDIGAIEVNYIASIEISKTPTSQTIPAGNAANFTITITNTGSVGLEEIVVTDALVPDCDFTLGALSPNTSETKTCSRSAVLADFTNRVEVTSHAQGHPGSLAVANASADVKIQGDVQKIYLPLILK